MKCAICKRNLLDTRQVTCYSRLCQKLYKERKQYGKRHGTAKERKELVKLLSQGCPKEGILLIMNMRPHVLNLMLAPQATRKPSFITDRLIPLDEV